MAETTTVSDILPVTGVGIIKGSRLCNFATSEHYLKTSHQAELDKVLEIIRKNSGYWVEIEGFASRAGDPTYNKDLSEKRAQSVRSYLEQGVTKLNVTVFTAFGEDESGGGERNNDGIWRAVTVRVFANKPPPKPSPPNDDKRFQRFAIRISSMASVSVPLAKVGQLDLVGFSMVDRDRNLCVGFQYTGGAAAPSSPFAISPVSFASKGPWTTFQILRHDLSFVSVVLDDFAGKAHLSQNPGAQLGGGIGGTVGLTFESEKIRKKKCGVVPGALKLSGGSGFQLPSGGSLGFGNLSMLGDIEPFLGVIVEGAITD